MAWKDLGRIIEALTPPEVKAVKLEFRTKIDKAMNEGLTLEMKRDIAIRSIKYRDRLLNADAEWRKQEGF